MVLGVSGNVRAITINAPEVSAVHTGNIVHCDAAVATHEFDEIFECGDELFATVFNALDGVGINVGDGGRFTRVPRTDLNGTGQWNRNVPARITGPNGQSCEECHGVPVGDGAGIINRNVIRDPQHLNQPQKFVQRNTPQVLALSGLQRLAEEMNDRPARGRAERDPRGVPARSPANRHNVTAHARLEGRELRHGQVVASPTALALPAPA